MAFTPQANAAPPPSYIVERDLKTNQVTDTMTQEFRQWLLSQTGLIQGSSKVASTPVSLTAQHASVGVSALASAIDAGTYRISLYARVTTPATVSSSLLVTLLWTDGAVACSVSSPAITGNTITTTLSFSQPLILADAGSNLSYSTTYASVGATPMQYSLVVIPERVG